jgi:hypothetical protein
MQPPRKPTPGTGDSRGLRVVGPRFYLWDPDPSEALRLAAELDVRRTRRPLNPRRRPPFRTPLA